MSRTVYLDPHADNPPLSGFLLIDDPVGLIEHALGLEPLHVQGQSLCDWAETFGFGRDWNTTYLHSLTGELASECPDLTMDEAKAILKRLTEEMTPLPRPLRLGTVVMAIWDRPDLWSAAPSELHAFRWLEWLAERPAATDALTLVRPLARAWHASAAPVLQRAYAAQTPDQAWLHLREWLRIAPSPQVWPTPPELLSEGLQRRLEDELIQQAVLAGTAFFPDLLDRCPGSRVLREAAHAYAQVLRNNPDQASSASLRVLRDYLDPDEWYPLLDLVPPGKPGLPEWTFQDLATWYRDKYLPYRSWVARGGQAAKRGDWVETNAEVFAREFLKYYVGARSGGDGCDRLASVKSSLLRTNPSDAVQLLVILDGLAYPDAEKLQLLLVQESRRLSLDSVGLALSPLPTVTEFAKDSVAKGVPPAEAPTVSDTRIHTTVDGTIEELLHAQPGDLVVWTEVQPDRAYHFRSHGSANSVRHEVEGELVKVVKGIARAVEMFPGRCRLRVIVTTDHGRLLTRVERSRPVPTGMTAHGRAAWGSAEVAFDASGVFVEDGLAYLHPGRFGLPPDRSYAVILTEGAFLTVDGRAGIEPFPHGGLFPEEVFVPWLEFTRDRDPIKLNVTLTGQGEESKPEPAVLTVANVSAVDLQLVRLKLPFIGFDLALDDLSVGRYGRREKPITLPNWPSKAQAEDAVATLVYRGPDGDNIEMDFRPNLHTVSMYERGEDILKDLGV